MTKLDTDIKPGIYQHFKGGLYEVFGSARHSETEEIYVVYRTLYDDKSHWLRPLAMFTEQVVHHGKTVPRFKFTKASVS